MERAQKVEAVDTLKGIFAEAGVVVVAHYAGLTVADMTGLRAKLREADGTLKVIKNRLAKIALTETNGSDAGTDLFQGPTAIVYADDPVGVSKVAIDYAKENEQFELLGAVLGASVLDAEGVKALSTMPSLDEMRAKLAGVLNAPGGKLAGTLKAPGDYFATALDGVGGMFASVLQQRKAQLEAA